MREIHGLAPHSDPTLVQGVTPISGTLALLLLLLGGLLHRQLISAVFVLGVDTLIHHFWTCIRIPRDDRGPECEEVRVGPLGLVEE